MFHAATVPLAHYATLRSGDEMYIVKKFDLETFLRVSTTQIQRDEDCRLTEARASQLIEKHKITEGAFVPPVVRYEVSAVISIAPSNARQVNMIINSPLSQKYSLKSIRIAHGGAAPQDKFSQARLKKMLAPNAPFAQVWGTFLSPFLFSSRDRF